MEMLFPQSHPDQQKEEEKGEEVVVVEGVLVRQLQWCQLLQQRRTEGESRGE